MHSVDCEYKYNTGDIVATHSDRPHMILERTIQDALRIPTPAYLIIDLLTGVKATIIAQALDRDTFPIDIAPQSRNAFINYSLANGQWTLHVSWVDPNAKITLDTIKITYQYPQG